MHATAQFERTAEDVADARSFVRDTLADWGQLTHVDDVVLMASELVTNAVLHGSGEVGVALALADDHVRVEVVDDGESTFPSRAAAPGPDALEGRGLAIVDALSDAWGGGRDDRGRTLVWVEVPCD